ncbi:MAG TPA: phosphomannose isomerase type II C-terminal cupin domain [bacterium]|nr:phosphomannose isomerase type II C-terminal cupin domain [bacterium]
MIKKKFFFMLDVIYEENRPWGNFRQFCLNSKVTVKILTVKANSVLSLQYHTQRSEFWRVVKGEGFVVKNDEEIPAQEGDEFFIPQGTNHRLKTGDKEMQVLEISFGNFDENDIVRLEDNYGRR